MKKTEYKFKCDKNIAENIINQFLKANNYKERTTSDGRKYYQIKDAISAGFLEYEFKEEIVIVYAYLRSEKKPMPLDDSFVGALPKSHYKDVIKPLLEALSNASSNSTNNVETVDVEKNNEEEKVNTTQNESTISTDNTYNKFFEENQKSKEKFAVVGFVFALIGLAVSFLGIMYGVILILLEYYFAFQGIKTKKRKLSMITIALATISIIINIIYIAELV